MKSILPAFAIAALLPSAFACSAATSGEPQLPNAGATASAGAASAAGGASAGSSAGGAQQGGTGGQQHGAAGNASGGMTAAGGASGGSGPLDGAALYSANCSACHGAQGIGGNLAPEIQHPVRDYAAWVVRHGRPGTGFPLPMLMIGADKLSDADLGLIWEYLDKPPQPTTGQALYHDYCANCHGADGKGGPTMRPITAELGKLKQQVRSGAGLTQMDVRHNYMPAFPTTRLSDAEVNLIYTYVGTL